MQRRHRINIRGIILLIIFIISIFILITFYLLEKASLVKSPLSYQLKSVQYMQPDANFKNLWINLDINKASNDFELLKSNGFNSIIIMIPWGEFQTNIDPITYNKDNIKKLHKIIKLASINNLNVILRMGTHEIVPEGVKGGDFWAGAIFTRVKDFRAYYHLFKYIAEETKKYSNILYFWTWEDTYLWPLPWYNDIEENQKVWISWCKKQNNSLTYWNNRWKENNEEWG